MKNTEEKQVTALSVKTSEFTYYIKGTSPLIMNSMSNKAKHELLMPRGKKTASQKSSSVKHEIYTEYRESTYSFPNEDQPTKLMFPASGIKSAISNAALDVPGKVAKSQVNRLVWVCGDCVPIYGKPLLYMAVTRCQDINKTPDIRTRAILPEWACKITIKAVQPNVPGPTVDNLLAAAGLFIGIGDYRQEKGKGNYGQFEIVNYNDEDFKSITEQGDREAQNIALEDPECYDTETLRLKSWYDEEFLNRYGKEAK